MPVRYMGTKRALAPLVRELIDDLARPGDRVTDLFSGMGSVASALAPQYSVTTNDLLTTWCPRPAPVTGAEPLGLRKIIGC
jgi:adenine-specific DNA methylase